MAAMGRAHRHLGHEMGQHRRPGGRLQRPEHCQRRLQLAEEKRELLSHPALPELLRAPLGVAGEILGRLDVGPQEFLCSHLGLAGETKQRFQVLLERLEPGEQLRKGLAAGRVPIGTGLFAPFLEQPAEAREIACGPRPAQQLPLQLAGETAELAGLAAATGKRVLQGGQQRRWREGLEAGMGQMEQKAPGRGLVQRQAAGVIHLELPAPQFGRHPAGQVAVGGYQDRPPPRRLQHVPKPQRQLQRLFGAIAGGAHHQPRQRLFQRQRGVGLKAAYGGAHHLRPQAAASVHPAGLGLGCEGPHRLPLHPQMVRQQPRQRPLRMGRGVPHLRPGLFVEPAVEPGQDHIAPGQARDHPEQACYRRHRAGHPRGDHRLRRRLLLPAGRQRIQKPPAALGRIHHAVLAQDRRPVIPQDFEELQDRLPVLGILVRRQPGDCLEPHLLGGELVQKRGEFARKPHRLFHRQPLGRGHEPGQQQNAQQRRHGRRDGGRHFRIQHQLGRIHLTHRLQPWQQQGALARPPDQVALKLLTGAARGQQDAGLGEGVAIERQQALGQQVEERSPRGNVIDARRWQSAGHHGSALHQRRQPVGEAAPGLDDKPPHLRASRRFEGEA